MSRFAVVLLVGLCLGTGTAPAEETPEDPLTLCKFNLKRIATGLELYADEHGGKYPSSLSELTPDYLKQIPDCPAAGADTYRNGYHTSPGYFLICCQGNFHQMGFGYPRYNRVDGMRDRPPLP